MIRLLFPFCLFIFLLAGCFPSDTNDKSNISANEGLKFDHILIFAKDNTLEKSLCKHLFTPATKLNTVHKEQGTRGTYILFFNTFIEFLYLNDSAKVLANEHRFGSRYLNRWKNENQSCPFSFGFILEPFDTSLIKFPFTPYYSLDNHPEEFYIMPTSNNNIEQPLVYLSMPHKAHKSFESFQEIDVKVDEKIRADVKNYLSHPSKVKKLTKIVLTIPTHLPKEGNVELLGTFEHIEIKSGATYKLLLIFDHHEQQKEFAPLNSNIEIRY